MKVNEIWIYLLVSILGLISILLPTFFLTGIKIYDSPLFPNVRTGIEGFSKWSFIFLFLSGFVVKLFSKLSSWKIGLMSMSLFPLMAFFEIIVDLTSHNMIPFELILYLIYSIPSILGAYVSQLLKSFFN